jgi:carbonic anhydrase
LHPNTKKIITRPSILLFRQMFSRIQIIVLLPLSFSAAGITSARAQNGPLWSYDGNQNGQEQWGALSHLYATCEMGKEQSPIVISFTQRSFKPPLEFYYKPAKATVYFDGHMLRVDMLDTANVLSSEATEYTLKSIAFHSPSGHILKEKFYPLEIEMLHENKDGGKLMLSLLAEPGQVNPALESIAQHASSLPDKKTEISFNPMELLPDERGYIAYPGSLTYPPCTEGVTWRVFKKPIQLSLEQMKRIGGVTTRNTRLPQPIYMRTLEETNR